MSRKSRALAALAEPEVPEVEEEPSERPIRSVHRAAMLDLKATANQIAALPTKARRALPLDDEAQAVFDQLATCEPTPERRRLVMRAKLMVGRVDPDLLAAALEGRTPASERDEILVNWRKTLLEGTEQALSAFIASYPGADRQQLRTTVRESKGTGPVAERAKARLLAELREAAARTDALAAAE